MSDRTPKYLPVNTTQLDPNLESLFGLWKTVNNVPTSNDYDMRGFYLGGLLGDPAAQTSINSSDGHIHFNDKWKLPNHHSFSNESMYSMGNDPRWVQPAPYREGTWAQYDPVKKGLLNFEFPMWGN